MSFRGLRVTLLVAGICAVLGGGGGGGQDNKNKGKVSAEYTKAYGDGISPTQQALTQASFTLQAYSDKGEFIYVGGATWTLALTDVTKNVAVNCYARILDNGNGTYSVSYTVPESGVYQLTVTDAYGYAVGGFPVFLDVQPPPTSAPTATPTAPPSQAVKLSSTTGNEVTLGVFMGVLAFLLLAVCLLRRHWKKKTDTSRPLWVSLEYGTVGRTWTTY